MLWTLLGIFAGGLALNLTPCVYPMIPITVSFFGGRATQDKPGQIRLGFWAPLLFVFIYAAGVCLFLPGTLLTALGAAIFGPYWGFLYVWIAAIIGAGLAFLIGRYLGRDFAAALIGDRLKRFDDAI